jgi:hypothetical protein
MRMSALAVIGFLCSMGRAEAEDPAPARVARAEIAFADVMDAAGIVSAIESGLFTSYSGRDAEHWSAAERTALAEYRRLVAGLRETDLSAEDARALAIMQRKTADLEPEPAASTPAVRCQDAQSRAAGYDLLRAALYACFGELGNAIEFEGARHTRVAALGMLSEIDEPERRKRLFDAFAPLWQAINGDNSPSSPYRRVIALAVQANRASGSEIDAAARTLGVTSIEVERWLERVLEAWRTAIGDERIEPWDYRYRVGEADRLLRASIPREQLMPINRRYYRDLGVDLDSLGARYDLDPRPGKAPVAYADFVTRGREIDGRWRPTLARVSGSYGAGGLGLLNELVHENGHIVQMMAVRTRPAFMDLGDAVFFEAFADVPSWNTYEPAWQRKYLGRSAPEPVSMRALYSGVMLDVAWALFECRMLRAPDADPNAVWTDITSRYLGIAPHLELAWWAVRVQLVDSPGYMVNYGLGAVLTADLRQRVREKLGAFETGRPDWFAWLSTELLQYGESLESAELLRRFLGRPVTPDALLAQLARAR